jgi:hypothetical protein
MKKVILGVLILIMIIPFGVFADGIPVEKITLEQQGAFQSVARVAENDFKVPTMVDVPIDFAKDSRLCTIVTDSLGVIVPSTIITKDYVSTLNLSASDSFGNMNANNMIDGQENTYVEFPFIEDDNEDTVVQKKEKNIVVIDINSDRMFKADSLHFTFDKNIQKPTRIRIISVKKNGEEQVLLPEQFFPKDKISFPQVNTDHYKIILNYIKPLRINEITFFEKGVPTVTKNVVRFIAQPKMAYDIYYNTEEFVKTKPMESPDFSAVNSNVQRLQVESVEDNAIYKKADTDKDGILDSQDNCISVANEDQIDEDENGKGDACEDFDRDGVMNYIDNCVLKANRKQLDKDADGIGDVCDDVESRFIEKYPWITYVVLFIVFIIVAVLIVKIMKD